MELRSCLRDREMQFNCPTLMSLVDFYIKTARYGSSSSTACTCVCSSKPFNQTTNWAKTRNSFSEGLRTSKCFQAGEHNEFLLFAAISTLGNVFSGMSRKGAL